jgi:hypothetical protein
VPDKKFSSGVLNVLKADFDFRWYFLYNTLVVKSKKEVFHQLLVLKQLRRDLMPVCLIQKGE